MSSGDMDLLDERRRVRGGMQAQITVHGHFTLSFSGEPDDRQLFFPACADRPQDVGRTSRSGNCHQDISRATEPENLPLEHSVIAIIVPYRRKYRAIGCQGDGRGWGSVIIQSRQHLSGNVLRVTRAAAITG